MQDRTIYEDAVFAKMLVQLELMDERDYDTYLSLFRHMSNFMCRPNLIVYLDVKPEGCREWVDPSAGGAQVVNPALVCTGARARAPRRRPRRDRAFPTRDAASWSSSRKRTTPARDRSRASSLS